MFLLLTSYAHMNNRAANNKKKEEIKTKCIKILFFSFN